MGERKCNKLVENIIKNSNGRRKWIINRIHELEKIDIKIPIDERNLCSAYNTLTWIPFEKKNDINELCHQCDFNKYRNLEIVNDN